MLIRQQRGAVLILVLWITVLLTLLLGAFSLMVRVDRGVAADVVQQVRSRAAGDSVLSYLAATRLVDDAAWMEMLGEIYVLPWEGFDVRFRFIPESSFVSLNAAPQEQLFAVFSALGLENADRLAEAVVIRRQGSLEMEETAEEAPRPWSSVEELIVLGGGLERLAGLSRWFSADSYAPAVTFDYAPPLLQEVLPDEFAADAAGEFQASGFEPYRVQVMFGVPPEARRAEFTAIFDDGATGYRLVRSNLYNARFDWD